MYLRTAVFPYLVDADHGVCRSQINADHGLSTAKSSSGESCAGTCWESWRVKRWSMELATAKRLLTYPTPVSHHADTHHSLHASPTTTATSTIIFDMTSRDSYTHATCSEERWETRMQCLRLAVLRCAGFGDHPAFLGEA